MEGANSCCGSGDIAAAKPAACSYKQLFQAGFSWRPVKTGNVKSGGAVEASSFPCTQVWCCQDDAVAFRHGLLDQFAAINVFNQAQDVCAGS